MVRYPSSSPALPAKVAVLATSTPAVRNFTVCLTMIDITIPLNVVMLMYSQWSLLQTIYVGHMIASERAFFVPSHLFKARVSVYSAYTVES